VAGSAILFIPSRDLPNVRAYVGIGISSYLSHEPRLASQRGKRVIFGLEMSGERWDGGPEVEYDLPNLSDSVQTGAELIPTVRVGIFMRRRF
jgi:hypothetical protein